eukprot:1094280-Karenia_brevis.AAC.1
MDYLSQGSLQSGGTKHRPGETHADHGCSADHQPQGKPRPQGLPAQGKGQVVWLSQQLPLPRIAGEAQANTPLQQEGAILTKSGTGHMGTTADLTHRGK